MPPIYEMDDADIVLALGEMRGQMHSVVESIISLRSHIDSLAMDLESHLRDMDTRLRDVERETFLLTRVGAFLAGCLTLTCGWLLSTLA